jgi:hypothetical protein
LTYETCRRRRLLLKKISFANIHGCSKTAQTKEYEGCRGYKRRRCRYGGGEDDINKVEKLGFQRKKRGPRFQQANNEELHENIKVKDGLTLIMKTNVNVGSKKEEACDTLKGINWIEAHEKLAELADTSRMREYIAQHFNKN